MNFYVHVIFFLWFTYTFDIFRKITDGERVGAFLCEGVIELWVSKIKMKKQIMVKYMPQKCVGAEINVNL